MIKKIIFAFVAILFIFYLAETSSAQFNYYINDHLGNTRVIVDEQGNVKEYYDYYPFGKTLRSSITDQAVATYKYSGKELDDENDLKWYYFGARYYDAEIGRWLIPDPALQKRDTQWLIENGYFSVSPYVYVFNNPMIFIDLAGDTITVSNDLAKTQQWQYWINSVEGKQFYAVFGAGGEWGHINVNFSFPKVLFGTVEASNKFLQSFGTRLSAFTGNTKLLEDGNIVKAVETGFENAPGYMPKEDAEYSFGVTLNPLSKHFNKDYSTIIHETDHVIYMTDRIIKNLAILNSYQQHNNPNLRMLGRAGTQYYKLPIKK